MAKCRKVRKARSALPKKKRKARSVPTEEPSKESASQHVPVKGEPLVETTHLGATRKRKAGVAKKVKKRKLQVAEALSQEVLQCSSQVLAASASNADLNGWPALEPWLREGGACLDALEVRDDASTCGLGVFARRDFAAGEVIFVVPTDLMLTREIAISDKIVERIANFLHKCGEPDRPEFLMCLRLCLARERPGDRFFAYAKSLPEASPGAACWPVAFREFLSTTSLKASLSAADMELNQWEQLLKKAASTDSTILEASRAFNRPCLEWARGMLQSRHFPGGFGGDAKEKAPCMVPLLDLLNHKDTADVTVKVCAGRLEFSCDVPVKAGEQIWNNYGSKANDELLMCYGFAVSDNPCDKVALALVSESRPNPETKSLIYLTRDGVPEEIVDAIENEQNTPQFIALLKAILLRKRNTKECLTKLPMALNFTVCKGPVARARKRSIESFLEGQLAVLERTLEGMQRSQEDDSEDEGDDEDEDPLNEEEEEELFMAMRKKKRRRR